MKPVTLASKLPEVIEYLQVNVPKDFPEYIDGVNEIYVKHLAATGTMVILSEDEDGINGVLVFTITDFLAALPGNLVAIEHVWHSKGKTGLKIKKAFEDYAKEIGCSHVFMGTTENPSAEKARTIYERSGYKLHETIFVKELI